MRSKLSGRGGGGRTTRRSVVATGPGRRARRGRASFGTGSGGPGPARRSGPRPAESRAGSNLRIRTRHDRHRGGAGAVASRCCADPHGRPRRAVTPGSPPTRLGRWRRSRWWGEFGRGAGHRAGRGDLHQPTHLHLLAGHAGQHAPRVPGLLGGDRPDRPPQSSAGHGQLHGGQFRFRHGSPPSRRRDRSRYRAGPDVARTDQLPPQVRGLSQPGDEPGRGGRQTAQRSRARPSGQRGPGPPPGGGHTQTGPRLAVLAGHLVTSAARKPSWAISSSSLSSDSESPSKSGPFHRTGITPDSDQDRSR